MYPSFISGRLPGEAAAAALPRAARNGYTSLHSPSVVLDGEGYPPVLFFLLVRVWPARSVAGVCISFAGMSIHCQRHRSFLLACAHLAYLARNVPACTFSGQGRLLTLTTTPRAFSGSQFGTERRAWKLSMDLFSGRCAPGFYSEPTLAYGLAQTAFGSQVFLYAAGAMMAWPSRGARATWRRACYASPQGELFTHGVQSPS